MMSRRARATGGTISIGRHTVGNGHRCFVIAEAGVNHNGRVDHACRLVDAAADAGCDAVKFQLFEPDLLVTAEARRAPYQRRSGADSQRAMLAKLALTSEGLAAVVQRARARRILFLATPFDEVSLERLVETGVAAIKLGSGEVTNYPLLRAAAATGRPVLLSTGMSDGVEVRAAVSELRGASAIMLFHCVTAYPAPIEAVNLRVIPALARRFHTPVGFSDHTEGSLAALGAVALGAAAVEKHLTLSRRMAGPDHAASLEPTAFRAFVRQIRSMERALGSDVKRCVAAERANMRFVRRSCVTRVAVPKGARLTSADVVAKRPGGGIPPTEIDRVIGRRVARSIPADTVLTWRLLGR